MYDPYGRTVTDFVLKDKSGNVVKMTDDKATNIQKILDFLALGNYEVVGDTIAFAENLADKNPVVIETILGSLRETEEKSLLEDDNNNILSVLSEYGYDITSAKKFDAMLGNGDIKEKLAELSKMREDALKQEKENEEKVKTVFVDFVRDVNLENIENIVAKDPNYSDTTEYFNNNPGTKKFLDSLQEFKKSFGVVEEYFRDQRHLEEYQEMLKDMNDRIDSLDNDDTLSSIEKNKQAVSLTVGKRQIMAEIKKYKDSCEEKKDAVKNLDLQDLKNKLLERINDLDKNYYKNLALNPAVMDELAQAIGNIRDRYVVFASTSLMYHDKMQKYEELCQKYGIKENTRIKEKEIVRQETVKEEKKENVIRDVPDLFSFLKSKNKGHVTAENGKIISDISLNNIVCPEGFSINDGKLTDGKISVDIEYRDPKKNEELHIDLDVAAAIDAIIAANSNNPNVIVTRVRDVRNGKFEDFLRVEGKIEDLQGTKDFEYIEGLGLTNGKIAIPVDLRLKKESILDKFKNLTYNFKSRLGSNKKFKVKQIRNAIIEPYGKAILLGSGIAFCGAVLAPIYVPLLSATLVGAGFSAAAEALYHLTKRGTNEKVSEFETTGLNPEADVNAKLTGLEKLKGMLVRKRKNKSEERSAADVEQAPEIMPIENLAEPLLAADAPEDITQLEAFKQEFERIQSIEDPVERAQAMDEFVNGQSESRGGAGR